MGRPVLLDLAGELVRREHVLQLGRLEGAHSDVFRHASTPQAGGTNTSGRNLLADRDEHGHADVLGPARGHALVRSQALLPDLFVQLVLAGLDKSATGSDMAPPLE